MAQSALPPPPSQTNERGMEWLRWLTQIHFRLARHLISGVIKGEVFETFADADATPSVAHNNNFKASNTGATTITAFDNGYNGQEIDIIFTNGNTTVQDGANLQLAGGVNFVGTSNDVLSLKFDGTTWFEKSRSVN